MNYVFFLVLVLSLLFTGSYCFAAETPPKKVENPFNILPFTLPKSDTSLYVDYRKKWMRLTGFEYSGLHWKQFVAIFTNKGTAIYRKNYLAYLSLYRDDDDEEDDDDETDVESFQEYEIGTIFLKENYHSSEGKPGQPSTLTIMIKREADFDPKGGNWEYIQTDVKGVLIMKGSSKNKKIQKDCSGCHANMAERDYIFSTFLTTKMAP